MVTPGLVSRVIRERAKERAEREKKQRKLWADQGDWHETIRGKLDGLFEDNQFLNFSRCGQEDFTCTCANCGTVKQLKYQCSLKWCPRCQWRRLEQRQRLLGLWVRLIKQPKHLVLTQRNFPVMTPRVIRSHRIALAKIRRTRCFEKVRGGCVSVEVTNEGQGWHLHSHWLLDVRWLDMPSVSRTWGKLVNQEFAIVKVMDCREQSYLTEVTKYVCSGAEMAAWPAEKIHEFVRAIKGKRFFFPFGSLFKEQADIRRALNAEEKEPMMCECGCGKFHFKNAVDSEVAAILRDCARARSGGARGGVAQASIVGGRSDTRVQHCLPGIEPGRSAYGHGD
jgi:Replication protein